MTVGGGILVIGAGFAGAVYARKLAEAGWSVTVIDRRDHIGGNAYDFVDQNGVRVHRYGPHLFHTNNARVVEWLRGFGDWAPYSHRVRILLDDGRFVPLPINLTTMNMMNGLDLKSEADAAAFLATKAVPIETVRNAADYLYSKIGFELTELFFRRYTRKMWSLDLEEMDESVVRRIPIRYDFDDRYFPNDRFQMLPVQGYTKLFENIFDHQKIEVKLSTEFEKEMERNYMHCFNSMPIDVYFNFEFGELPYRSIRFHTRTIETYDARSWSVTNFSDETPFTRETWWHLLPHHLVENKGLGTVTVEEPCDYRDNNLERYYPVKAADGRYQRIYQRYKEAAEGLPNVDFIGRCGTYQYLDMDQVINQSLQGVEHWIAAKGTGAPESTTASAD